MTPLTVTLTGATGYIARHILLRLLDAGHTVRGTMRDAAKGDRLREAIVPRLADPAAIERLSLVSLDLTRDAGWADAMTGADALLHTASPFPLSQPKAREELVAPAVEGTRRALGAAAEAGVTRVVLTSSINAIVYGRPPGAEPYTEGDWTDPDAPGVTAYSASKTLAERAAWDMAGERGLHLTVVNPGFVLGAPIGREAGTSVGVVGRVMKAADPAVPRVGFSSVDVRDVAEIHVAALADDSTVGERIIATNGFLTFLDIAREVQAELPGRKVVTREAPNLLIRALSLVDRSIHPILPDLGTPRIAASDRAERVLGRPLRDVRAAVRETARHLDAEGLA